MVLAPPKLGVDLNPYVAPFKAERLFRVHPIKTNANSFNPGYGKGRFHPIYALSGKSIPTLYASDRINGALSETIFRNKISGDTVYHAELMAQYLSRLSYQKELWLVDLTGSGIKRLGITRTQLLESGEDDYAITARWAEALHHTASKAHGIQWVSRQFDTARSILLFGDRIKPSQLKDLRKSESLEKGVGLRRVQKAASEANITLVVR